MASERIEIEIILDDGRVQKAFVDLEKLAGKLGKTTEGGLGKAAEGLRGTLEEINPALAGVVSKIGSLAPALLAVGAAAAAVKGIFEATFEAEHLAAVNRQFELLTSNAGISGDALRDSFERAAQGLVSTDSILQSANRSVSLLGAGAAQLGPIFELAMKTAAITGGDAITSFELLSNAIASGNTRALRQVGIFIDSEKAIKDYALSIGASVKGLSEAGKQQAILEAVLAKSATALKGVDVNASKATAAYTRFTVAIEENFQTLSKATAQSSILERFFNKLSGTINSVTTAITANFGDGLDKTIAQQKSVGAEIDRLNSRIAYFNAHPMLAGNELETLNIQLRNARAELSLINEQILRAEQQKPKAKADTAADPINHELQAAAEGSFQKRISDIQKAALAERAQFAVTKQEKDQVFNDQELQKKIAFELQLKELDRAAKEAGLSDDEDYQAKKQQLKDDYAELELLRQKEHELRAKATADLLNKAISSQLANALSQSIQFITSSLLKGQLTFENFSKFILGVLGDAAIQIGGMAIAAGLAIAAIGSISPGAAIAAGAALIAIGTVMKSLSGGAGDLGSQGSANGSAPGIDSGHNSTAPQTLEREKAGTQVTVNVQGSILDRRETGLAIAEIIADSFDLNGTKIITGLS